MRTMFRERRSGCPAVVVALGLPSGGADRLGRARLGPVRAKSWRSRPVLARFQQIAWRSRQIHGSEMAICSEGWITDLGHRTPNFGSWRGWKGGHTARDAPSVLKAAPTKVLATQAEGTGSLFGLRSLAALAFVSTGAAQGLGTNTWCCQCFALVRSHRGVPRWCQRGAESRNMFAAGGSEFLDWGHLSSGRPR